MRYTTILDIREFPSVWRSVAARQLYVYMCLAAGYEDYNRDELRESIRQLADHSGLTLSACRHALELLQKSRLVVRREKLWKVAKWIQAPTISPRELNKRMSKQQAQEQAIAREREEKNREREAAIAAQKAGAVSYEEWRAMRSAQQQH